jgi:cytochrome c peroxidase
MRLLVAAAVSFALAFAVTVSAHPGIPPNIEKRIPKKTPGFDARRAPPSVIELGRRIFESETFGGNGRTCATCHRASENFALSPADVARRPDSDPLFVHEQRPELRDLEDAVALRERALICENLDGFDRPCVLRASPHLFGLGLSTAPEPGVPVTHTLGWGGDGSPGDGSLRNFVVGAIVQHMPKRLDRVPDVDFRMPTAVEMDALLAFQLSLGRRETPIVDPALSGALVFLDPDVRAGQVLFAGMPSRQGTRRCSGCHTGGGALNDLDQNEQRANALELSPDAAPCHFPDAPGDGGFGTEPVRVVDRATFCRNGASGPVEFRGNSHFSTPSTIEAADTAPFFHDHSANTMEEVVEFYATDTFNDSITGAGNGFLIPVQNRNQIAAFVRALNVLENIRSTIAAIETGNRATARRDVRDAIAVLGQGVLRPYQTTALPALRRARAALVARPALALAELERARAAIAR